MPRTQTRLATTKDLPGLERLLNELLMVIEDDTGIDRAVLKANCQALVTAPDSFIMVAEREDELIGLASVNLRRTLLHTGPSALLDELVVTAACRGTGTGTQLLHAVIDHCRRLGCCEIEASTEEANDRARAFYRRCGFDERGILFEKELEASEQ